MKAFGAEHVGTGEKKPLSPYIRFYTMRIKQMNADKRPVKEKMAEIVEEWKGLSKEEKEDFSLILQKHSNPEKLQAQRQAQKDAQDKTNDTTQSKSAGGMS